MPDLLQRHRLNGRGRVLTASSEIVPPSRGKLRISGWEWQREVWDFHHSCGTFQYANLWHSQTMSRVRLTAAKVTPGGDEPEPIVTGAPYDLMSSFFGGTIGQAQYMANMDLQMICPGEGFVIGETDEFGEQQWCVASRDMMRVSSGRSKNGTTVDVWELKVDEGVFRPLPEDTLVFRQWHPDPQYAWRPDSPARAALTDLRMISLLQRRLMAQTVSRLASNGVLLYPQEVTFPVKEQYRDAPDPFSAELLDITRQAINDPGSASAAIPLYLKIPREYIKDFTHLDFANKFDEYALPILEFFYDRLATDMNMPKEVVTGMGKTSHWNAWSLDEQGIEVHIKPGVEALCAGITRSYLRPGLLAAGAPIEDNGSRIICWYDTSELDVPPDRSTAADAAFDRQAINLPAYRREKGFGEADAPTEDQLQEQLLLQLAKDPASAPSAIEALTGTPVAGAPTPGPGAPQPGTPPAAEPAPAAGPPVPPPDGGTGQPNG